MESQLTENFNGQVLFQNSKYSIEMCDVLHLRNEFKTDKKQICVIVDEFKTNWVRPNNKIDLLYLDFSLPQYIVDKTLSKIRKHKDELFYQSLN